MGRGTEIPLRGPRPPPPLPQGSAVHGLTAARAPRWSPVPLPFFAPQARLFRLADPLGAVSINIFRPGWHHAWHFDESEFTTTLCLQQSDAGGEFEFTPPLRRSQDDLAAPAVASAIASYSPYRPTVGDSLPPPPPVSVAGFEPGTLQIFAGRYSLHHVKRIPDTATRERLVAVLCFASEAGVVNSPEVQRMFWGRSAPPVPDQGGS